MDKHDESCELCAATKRVFGDRFGGCAAISNDMAIEAVELMKKKTNELLAELEQKHETGLVNDRDYNALRNSIKRSFPFAASNVPAVALISGANSDPSTMLELVRDNMVHMVKAIFELKLKKEGPSALLDTIMILKDFGAPAPDPNDPNVN